MDIKSINDIEPKMVEIAGKIVGIKNLQFRDPNKKTHDKAGFVYDLDYLVDQIKYFYDTIVPNQGCINNPTKAYYPLSKRPKEHQVAYFNLTRGFPKELFGGHLCYIVKDMSSKYLVIPTTSAKGIRPRNKFEVDIEIKDYINNEQTRLQVNDMRCIDKQRLYVDKNFYNVETDRSELLNEVKIITGLN